MPVFFYIDPDFVNDPNMKGIEQVTLSYTFFSEYCYILAEGKCELIWKQKRDMTRMGILNHMPENGCIIELAQAYALGGVGLASLVV